MKAEELRVGNYVKNQDGTLTGTPIGKPVKLTLDDFDKWLGFYVPISLTKEWLVKLGFIHMYGVYYSYHGLEFNLEDGYIDNGHSIINLKLPVKFVHQLQNIIWALTGKELTI